MIGIQFIIIYNIRCKKICVNVYCIRERNVWGRLLQQGVRIDWFIYSWILCFRLGLGLSYLLLVPLTYNLPSKKSDKFTFEVVIILELPLKLIVVRLLLVLQR